MESRTYVNYSQLFFSNVQVSEKQHLADISWEK